MNSFTIIFFSLFFSTVFTGVFRKYALKYNLLDVPNERSSHLEPTPRGGGVVIVGVFLMMSGIIFLYGKISLSIYIAFSVGGILVTGIGLLDDKRAVPAPWRLLVHFLAFGSALYLIGTLYPFPIPGAKWYFVYAVGLVTVFVLVWILNLFNFMDGIDGIAASEAVSVLTGAAAIVFMKHGVCPEFILLLLLASACGGFLFWNWPPAKIFMGDAGSGFLGYIIGVFALWTTVSGSLSLWVWLILLGVFLMDATVTLIRRFIRGEKIYQAHCSHAYQNAARIYQSHKKVTLYVLLINLVWLFPLAFSASQWPDLGWLFAIIALTPLVVLAIKLGAGLRDFGFNNC